MNKILVTGGAGYIGSHVALELLDGGYDVVVLDDLSCGFEFLIDKRAKFFRGCIGDVGLVGDIIDGCGIDGVVHLAGFIAVGESVLDPLKYYDNNAAKSLRFLQVLVDKKVGNFVFSSTAAVFGNVGKDEIPINENCLKKPINPYGRSKLFIEDALVDIGNVVGDFNSVILRYFNACGADFEKRAGECHDPETHLIPLAIRAAMDGGVMKVFGDDYDTFDGTCVRDYIHVSDLARIHVLALNYLFDGGKSDDFNCGYKKGFSVRQIIDVVKDVAGDDFEVVVEGKRSGDPDILIADNFKLVEKLGFKARFCDLKTIIESAYGWEKKRRKSFLLK